MPSRARDAVARAVEHAPVRPAGRVPWFAERPAGRIPGAGPEPADSLDRGRTAELAVIGAMVGFAGLLGAVRAGRADAVDLAVTLRVQSERRPWLGPVMSAVSWPGFPPQSRLIPPGIVTALLLGGRRLEALLEGVAWGTALLSTVVKAFVRRPRPVPPQVRVVVAPLGGTSFPSGHVLTYVGVYGFLAYIVHTLVEPPAVRRAIVGSLLGLVALVGPSRIQQGHHWPSDVVASYLLGTAYVAALGALYVRLRARGRA